MRASNQVQNAFRQGSVGGDIDALLSRWQERVNRNETRHVLERVGAWRRGITS
jgi:hypothetical protein